MTAHKPTDQTELTPEVPSGPRLRKLRALIPMAEAIIEHAREVHILHPDGEDAPGKVGPGDMKVCAQRRRALDRKLDSLGLPLRGVPLAEFPEGTVEAARASSEFYVALESACSALASVNAAERAAIPRNR